MKEKKVSFDSNIPHFAIWDDGEDIGLSLFQENDADTIYLFRSLLKSKDKNIQHVCKLIASSILAWMENKDLVKAKIMSKTLKNTIED